MISYRTVQTYGNAIANRKVNVRKVLSCISVLGQGYVSCIANNDLCTLKDFTDQAVAAKP